MQVKDTGFSYILSVKCAFTTCSFHYRLTEIFELCFCANSAALIHWSHSSIAKHLQYICTLNLDVNPQIHDTYSALTVESMSRCN